MKTMKNMYSYSSHGIYWALIAIVTVVAVTVRCGPSLICFLCKWAQEGEQHQHHTAMATVTIKNNNKIFVSLRVWTNEIGERKWFEKQRKTALNEGKECKHNHKDE